MLLGRASGWSRHCSGSLKRDKTTADPGSFPSEKSNASQPFPRSLHYKAQAAKHGGRRLDERWVAASRPNSSVLMENVPAVISLTQQPLVWRDNFVFFPSGEWVVRCRHWLNSGSVRGEEFNSVWGNRLRLNWIKNLWRCSFTQDACSCSWTTSVLTVPCS